MWLLWMLIATGGPFVKDGPTGVDQERFAVLPDAKRPGQTCLGRLCRLSFTRCPSAPAVCFASAINSAHAPNPWMRMSMPIHTRH